VEFGAVVLLVVVAVGPEAVIVPSVVAVDDDETESVPAVFASVSPSVSTPTEVSRPGHAAI
jgi:hypothetical protein